MRQTAYTITLILGLLTQGLGQSASMVTDSGLRGGRFLIDKGSMMAASAPSSENRDARGLAPGPSHVLSSVTEAEALIRQHHVDHDGSIPSLAGHAAAGALAALDPHSRYLTRNEFIQLTEEQRSEYSGIGATIGEFSNGGPTGIYILATFPGSPARRAGMKFGDRITRVDGRGIEDLSSEEVRHLIRGRARTYVELQYLRPGGDSVSVRLMRAPVSQPTVADSYMLRPGVGYIDITEGFSETTVAELGIAIRGLRVQGMTSLVLDLRGNPGGILDQAVKAAEIFLPSGTVILRQTGRAPSENRVWRSFNANPETMPVAVLVNRDTASAAEILAGALQDNRRATVIGEQTFGKGLVQSIITLSDGSGLTLTTGRYRTPSGRSVQRDYSTVGRYGYFRHHPAPETDGLGIETGMHDDGIIPDLVISDNLSRALRADPPAQLFFNAVDFYRTGLLGAEVMSDMKPSGPKWHSSRLPDSLVQSLGGGNSGGTTAGPSAELRLRSLFALAELGAFESRRVLVVADPLVETAASRLVDGGRTAKKSGRIDR